MGDGVKKYKIQGMQDTKQGLKTVEKIIKESIKKKLNF